MKEPTIEVLDNKINRFITSQDKHNDKVTSAIEKMSDTISSLNTVHVEINHLSEKITSCESEIKKYQSKLELINDKVVTNSIQSEDFKHIKRLFTGFVITTLLGGGFVAKITSDNYSNKDAVLQQQAKAMIEIASAIKNSSVKGK